MTALSLAYPRVHRKWQGWRTVCLLALAGGFTAASASVAVAAQTFLSIDFSRTNGLVRPLHGINKGPVAAGGLIDLTGQHRFLNLPFVRLHDCQWPYPDVVDMHAIFRDPAADPLLPGSYDFLLTDAYMESVARTGAQIIYRLGESIEHAPVKRYVHPPRDPERWAAACLGIIRHYNEGWANGFRYGIRYWEVWNEPENRPAMWSGTDQDYFRLYAATAWAIKAAFPKLKVGGPGLGHTGTLSEGSFEPSAFMTNFLAYCRQHSLPLDFFSWHCYASDADELPARARGIRRVLNEHGFSTTESHLNEWNYLPDNSWAALGVDATPQKREEFNSRCGGPEGAAFAVSAMIAMQSAPVDVCAYFHGELGGFGLFSEHGNPNHVYRAFAAFSELQKLGSKVYVQSPEEFAVVAASSSTSAAALLACEAAKDCNLRVEFSGLKGRTNLKANIIERQSNWRLLRSERLEPDRAGKASFLLQAEGPCVVLLVLSQ